MVENIHSPAIPPENLEETYSFLPRLKIPPANATKAWADVDETIDLCLQQSHPSLNKLPARQNADSTNRGNQVLFYNRIWRQTFCRFQTANHASQLKHLQKRKCQLRREWRNGQNEAIENTAALRSEFHAVLERINRLSAQLASAEKKANRSKNTRPFRANPYSFGMTFFSDKVQSCPDFSVEEAMIHFTATYTDNDRPAGYMPFHKDTPKALAEPTVPFPTAIPSRSLFQSNLRRPEIARRLAQAGSRTSFGRDAPRCNGGYTQCCLLSLATG